MDAFFFGKAFAEVLNERLGEAADDLLVEFGKRNAERRQAFRSACFQWSAGCLGL